MLRTRDSQYCRLSKTMIDFRSTSAFNRLANNVTCCYFVGTNRLAHFFRRRRPNATGIVQLWTKSWRRATPSRDNGGHAFAATTQRAMLDGIHKPGGCQGLRRYTIRVWIPLIRGWRTVHDVLPPLLARSLDLAAKSRVPLSCQSFDHGIVIRQGYACISG